jgi:hypothetical protein
MIKDIATKEKELNELENEYEASFKDETLPELNRKEVRLQRKLATFEIFEEECDISNNKYDDSLAKFNDQIKFYSLKQLESEKKIDDLENKKGTKS